jgi:DNA-binding transcriptional ArsR family regulator
LGDESRRRIVSVLGQRGRCSAGELVALFDSAQPTISKHLRVLELAGLVRREQIGRQHFFVPHEGPLAEAEGWIHRHLDLWRNSLKKLEQLLGEGERGQQ